MHELEHPVAATLHRQMRVSHQLWQTRVGLNKVIAIALGMRRGEPNALDPLNFMHRFNELHECALAVLHANLAATVAINNLTEQSDFLYATVHKFTTFTNDILNAAATLTAPCVRNDAESAKLIAALHDTHEGSNCLADAGTI